jgi:streptogramin lyase
LALGRREIALTLAIIAACVSLAVADRVTIHEWELPKPRYLPLDLAVGPDGALWYTVMPASTIGRLDPQSGKIRDYPLKTSGSGSHGLVADQEGNFWFKGYVGRLDPRTGMVTAYPMPGPAARDPIHLSSTLAEHSGSPHKWDTSLAGSTPVPGR